MQENWAAEHLQVIRTLMERSAVYRRALAPLMTFAGVVGTAAAAIAWQQRIDTPRPFVLYWSIVSLVALAGAFVLVRRQAIRAGEVVWSPPMRRIGQALLPGLFVGAVAGGVVWFLGGVLMLPAIWASIYGCALHAAGFFMPRGIRLFGGCFVVAGAVLILGIAAERIDWAPPNLVMGFFFGLIHLAYGIYLYFTEQRRNPL
jgi:hypothetical protein